jgi:hypothetical protein
LGQTIVAATLAAIPSASEKEVREIPETVAPQNIATPVLSSRAEPEAKTLAPQPLPQVLTPSPQSSPSVQSSAKPVDPDVGKRDKFFKEYSKWERGEGPKPEIPESMRAAPQNKAPAQPPPVLPSAPSPVTVTLNLSPSPQMQDLVRAQGAQGKNMVFTADKESALDQQSLMSSPAMLDSMKSAGLKHIFMSGYPQSLQDDFSMTLWDAARSGKPEQLVAAKNSFSHYMETQRGADPLKLRDNYVPMGQESALYRGTATMIAEAAKRGIQVHFMDKNEMNEDYDHGLQQAADEALNPVLSEKRMRERNDHDSEFIKLTARGERYAIMTGDRRMQGENALTRKLDDTVHIGLSGTAQPGNRDIQPDYSYSIRDMKLEELKSRPRSTAPSAPQVVASVSSISV